MNSEELQAKKGRGEPIVVLTCYDSPTAAWQEAAGVDVVFCADSVGTNLLGYDDERQVTMEDMIHHLKAVRRGLGTAPTCSPTCRTAPTTGPGRLWTTPCASPLSAPMASSWRGSSPGWWRPWASAASTFGAISA